MMCTCKSKTLEGKIGISQVLLQKYGSMHEEGFYVMFKFSEGASEISIFFCYVQEYCYLVI